MTKKIHFIWVDKYDISNDHVILPKRYEANIKTWKQVYHDYDIKVWKGSEILHMINNINEPIIKETFHAYKHFISKLDFVRFLILYLEGGLYVDTDTFLADEVIKGKTPRYEFDKNKCLCMFKEQEHLTKKNYPGYDYVVINGYIWSPQREPLLLEFLSGMVTRIEFETQHILLSTGPAAMRHIIKDRNINVEQIKFLPSDDFINEHGKYTYTTYDNTWVSGGHVPTT